jgi:hypothetical protein
LLVETVGVVNVGKSFRCILYPSSSAFVFVHHVEKTRTLCQLALDALCDKVMRLLLSPLFFLQP